jgi:7-cyano-7-deazaguanine synthase
MTPASEEYWFKQLKANATGYQDRIDEIKKSLINARGYVFEKPLGEHVVILLSGGMDSTTLVDLVASQWKSKIILLYFLRDARNQEHEEAAVDFFHAFYKKKYPEQIIDLVKIPVTIPSRTNRPFMDKHRQHVMGLPMRNATMWAMAVTQAVYLSEKYKTTIRTLLVGSVQEDSDSPESGYLSVLSMSLHACICLGIWNFQVNAPLMDNSLVVGGMFKKGLVEYCKQHGIPLEKTWSCFDGSEAPCGKCLACKNREAAFKEAT